MLTEEGRLALKTCYFCGFVHDNVNEFFCHRCGGHMPDYDHESGKVILPMIDPKDKPYSHLPETP